ncbi:subtilisin-like protein [Clavulina sp. PMI_390]|nr:subtilisin-like protein [Clavulina sp. PMI_390]
MRSLALIAALLCASHAIAGPTARSAKWARSHEKKSSLKEVPRGWEQLDEPVREDHTITLNIGLKQLKFAQLVEELYAWLSDHGIDLSTVTRTPAKEWVKVTVPIEVAAELAGADYKVYRNVETGRKIVRALEYSLPRALHDHIDTVQPTNFFGFRQMDKHSFVNGPFAENAVEEFVTPGSDATVPSSCSTTITPSCLRTLYNTASYTPVSYSNNTIGVAGYLKEYASDSDLQTFFKKYRTDATGYTITHTQVNGGLNTQSSPGVEANLDVQYVTGIAYPTKVIYYSTGGSPPYTADGNTPSNTNEPYLDWLNYLATLTTLPATFSTSYGDDEQTVPLDYATSVCNMFAQVGARGSSLLFSSGDSGVGGGSCKSNDGTNKVKFLPTFPAACPYVTSVGGTYKNNPEVGISFSQGGFSNYFAQPSYQASAVSTFLTAQGSTYSTYYNATGRGFPDVAAQSDYFAVVVSGSVESVGGTSAAAPTFAAIVGLLNDYRISQGKATLGFLNPWLYSTGKSGLTDITSGSNPGCGTNGFTARAGWDPVTGLGTPNFTGLQAVLP